MPPEASAHGKPGASGDEISRLDFQHSPSHSPSSDDDEGVNLATASRRPAPETPHAHPLKLRSALSHKNHPNPNRHVVKAYIGGRTTSLGTNLNKLAVQQQHAAMPSGGNTTTPQRPQSQRSNSHVLSSSTATSPRLGHAVRRNTSAFVISRAAAHSTLKKNHSSGHLSRHAATKNMAKAGRPSAPPMKRSQSSKSVTSQKSQKSPVEPQHQHTVRFDLGDEHAPGDDTDDNEWTDNSTSISPATTRDHTRQNSVILSSVLQARPAIAASSSTAKSSAQVEPSKRDSQGAGQHYLEPKGIRRNASSHSNLTPDAITSRLLMRTPSMNSTALSQISATAVGTPTLSHSSHSPPSTLQEGSASGSGGRDLVSRFLAGGSSHGTTSDMLGTVVLPHGSSRQGSLDQGSDDENPSRPLDSNRRNKSTPNVAGAKTGRSSSHTAARLPPSRTSQKLELQRASTLVEPARKVPVVPSRPTAPLLLSSGMNSLGFGNGESGSVPAQLQGLFAQIDKEYSVVRRFRRPVQDAIGRLERKHGSIESVVKAKGPANRSSVEGRQPEPGQPGMPKQPGLELRYPKPHNRDGAAHQSGSGVTAPEHLNQRRSRVSFELPDRSRGHGEELETGGHHRTADSDRDEAFEICRRMWDLSNVVETQA